MSSYPPEYKRFFNHPPVTAYNTQHMNRYWLSLIFILLAAFSAQGQTLNSAACELVVFQKDKQTNADVPLFRDTVLFYTGIRASAFLTAFSTEIELTAADTAAATFSTTIATLGPLNSTRARQFHVEYGLPARMADIEVKPGVFYRLDIIPLYPVVSDTSECSLRESAFSITPSANLDIYYVPGTIGDFFLPGVKGLVETTYDRAKKIFGFTLPGKYHFFLSPCEVRNAIWDNRFGLSTNPLRSTAHVIFTRDFNAADPFPIIHTALLRSWGYAPAPLVDGLASFYSLALFDTKELRTSGTLPKLDTLLNTASYLRAEPYAADRGVAAFCDFLMRKYGMKKVELLYQLADDLTLREKTETVLGTKIADLEEEWHQWIDTTTFTRQELSAAADIAEVMFDYRRMTKLAQATLKLAANKQDSVKAVDLLRQAEFSSGNYEDAVTLQRTLTDIQPGATKNWISLGSYLMMAGGDTASAASAFRTAIQLDSVNAVPIFNLALMHANSSNYTTAVDLLLQATTDTRNPFAEANILLAILLKQTGRKDKDPIALYKKGITQLEQVLSSQRSPYLMAWIGRGYLGLGDTENAFSYLHTASQLETRPFYEGLIHLWLGNLLDQLGERDAAKQQYAAVIAMNSAAYTKKEARQFLDSPFVVTP